MHVYLHRWLINAIALVNHVNRSIHVCLLSVACFHLFIFNLSVILSLALTTTIVTSTNLKIVTAIKTSKSISTKVQQSGKLDMCMYFTHRH